MTVDAIADKVDIAKKVNQVNGKEKGFLRSYLAGRSKYFQVHKVGADHERPKEVLCDDGCSRRLVPRTILVIRDLRLFPGDIATRASTTRAEWTRNTVEQII